MKGSSISEATEARPEFSSDLTCMNETLSATARHRQSGR